MRSRRSPPTSATSWYPFLTPFAFSVSIILVGAPVPAAAQDEALVNVVGSVLAAQDARRFDGPLLNAAARHRDPIARRHAALAMGRIGDRAATQVLLELLSDRDPVVQREAAFALGQLADPSALRPLRDLLWNTPATEQNELHEEAATALVKIGGTDGAQFVEELLVRWLPNLTGELPRSIVAVLGEAWRLQDHAPVALLTQYGESDRHRARLNAVYSLSRLRTPDAANVFLAALDDPDPLVVQLGVRALTRDLATAAELSASAVATRVSRLVEHSDPGVRINALRTLGSFQDPGLAEAAGSRTSDPVSNVRVQALLALGALGGSDAARTLRDHVDEGPLALREQALRGLARVDRTTAIRKSAGWITSTDWRLRHIGAGALGIIAGDTAAAWLQSLLGDDDGRVVGRAFRALTTADSSRAARMARDLLDHADPVVRRLAANQVARAPHDADSERLITAYAQSLTDPISDARIAIIEALGAVAQLGSAQRLTVERRLLALHPTCDDYLVRRTAEEHLPGVAATWGASFPVATGRSIEDYRDLVRRLVLPVERGEEKPALVIETDLGRIAIVLYPEEAPVTVNALLELADRQFFDDGTWHRVVPNFVIQDGDPRGDGEGGPGFALRDENSRLRYGRGTVGMALAGPDTGGSQFFITHAPQPHLDGTYPVVGRVESGIDVVDRLVQGDRIRTIRRR